MPGVLISVRAEGEIHHTVAEEQPGPLVFMERIERDMAARRSIASAGNAGLNNDRAAKLLGAGCDIESMQPLHVVCTLLGRGNDVQCPLV